MHLPEFGVVAHEPGDLQQAPTLKGSEQGFDDKPRQPFPFGEIDDVPRGGLVVDEVPDEALLVLAEVGLRVVEVAEEPQPPELDVHHLWSLQEAHVLEHPGLLKCKERLYDRVRAQPKRLSSHEEWLPPQRAGLHSRSLAGRSRTERSSQPGLARSR